MSTLLSDTAMTNSARPQPVLFLAIKIVALSVAAAVSFGVIHNQVTARICVEYFTIGHPPVFGTEDPTLLGIGWGIIATWWVGVMLGVPLAVVSLRGPYPRRTGSSLLKPLAMLLLLMAVMSTIAGLVGHALANRGWVVLIGEVARRVPEDRHVAFLTCLWAHSASYLGGFVGGIVLMVRVRAKRRRVH